MCRSCTTKFHGKYLQQCDYCGHPDHEGNFCGVGVIRNLPLITQEHNTIGCECKEERYV